MTDGDISIIFSGDFAPLLEPKELQEDHFSDIQELVLACDLHVTNLECPLTLSGKKIEKSGPHLKAHPDAVKLLKQAGVDIACLANNHIFDYDEQGLLDTINACGENEIECLGVVSRPDNKPQWLIKEVKGKKIGLLNYCEHEFSVRERGLLGASGYDPIDAFHDIKLLRPKVDWLIVIYHGGNEYYALPRPALKKDFRYLADVGADVVIGHHTHVFSGYEIYNEKLLVYGLGNFFFPFEGEPEPWNIGALMILKLKRHLEFELNFINQCNSDTKVRLILNEQKVISENVVSKLSDIISNDEELRNYWQDYVIQNGPGLERAFLYPSIYDKILYKAGFKVYSKRHIGVMLNIERCRSLADLFFDSLKAKIR